jgi:uncharacterized RDD family membrane protein YckC
MSFIILGKRWGSFITDYFVFGFISALFLILLGFPNHNKGETTIDNLIRETLFCLSWIGLAIALCKDSISGQSSSKRHFDLLVVSKKTGSVASPVRCLIRNLFFIFSTIDFILLLINHENQKIGDWVAGTKVISIDPYKHSIPTVSRKQIASTFILAYCLCITVAYSFKYWIWG